MGGFGIDWYITVLIISVGKTDRISNYDVIINDDNNTCEMKFVIHFMNYIK